MEYDSTYDILNHVFNFKRNIDKLIGELKIRANSHDVSKLNEPEKSIFDKYTPELKKCEYMSPEYLENLKNMKPALEHHYACSRHHPEWEDFNILEWRDIKGYEGLYQISNYGDVKRLQHLAFRQKQGNFMLDEMILKACVTPYGYLRIQLSNNGLKKNHFVHRLVAEAFIENIENQPIVNHKDGNKKNNFYKNLEWCDNSENQLHAYKNELRETKYIVHCQELNLTTLGCGEMCRQLIERGYKNPRESMIVACINGDSSHHLGLNFEGTVLKEYRRSKFLQMTFVDLIDMLCDWKAASERNLNGDIYDSIEKNQIRFGYGDELKNILINTINYLKENEYEH
jgi:hypothetical protein